MGEQASAAAIATTNARRSSPRRASTTTPTRSAPARSRGREATVADAPRSRASAYSVYPSDPRSPEAAGARGSARPANPITAQDTKPGSAAASAEDAAAVAPAAAIQSTSGQRMSFAAKLRPRLVARPSLLSEAPRQRRAEPEQDRDVPGLDRGQHRDQRTPSRSSASRAPEDEKRADDGRERSPIITSAPAARTEPSAEGSAIAVSGGYT